MKIKLRPHHFLCTIGFQGKGYSLDFIENYTKIVEQLNDDTEIIVLEQTDSICAPCPHKREKLCEIQEKIDALDKAHAQVLDIKAGDVLNWKEAKERVATNISVEKFNEICAPCLWKELGVCEAALKKLKSSRLG